MSIQASILEMARGAIMEQVDIEVGRIIANILDVNTDAKKKRALNLTVSFTPSSERSQVVIEATAQSKLQPNNSIQTSLYVGKQADTGEIIATELTPSIPGQINISGEEQEETKTLKMVVGGNR